MMLIHYSLPTRADLPAEKVAWPLVSSRAALLVHDVQLHFIKGYERSFIDPVLKNIAHIIEWAHANEVPVFYSAQGIQDDPVKRGLLTDMWGAGLTDPSLVPIAPEVAFPDHPHTFIEKKRYSAFMYTNFEEELAKLGKDQLIITGVFANIGCLATATDAFMRDMETFFVADAAADFDREQHWAAMDRQAKHVGRILLTEDFS
ncbi:MAG: isochorismatase family protein [Corynebacterium sp.]|nr:isochorismatase family protein [Corynebacterium sp.]